MSTLFLGDCLDVMHHLADNSIDSIVTDPPYGLGFMGKDWDHGVPGVAFWQEALRVAKPGAHLLAFGGTRTYHRLACAIEDAGWEIRDCIMWVYGSGFPKSMDVAKAIDKMRGNSQRFQRMYAEAVRESGLNHADIDRRLGIKSSSCYWVREDDRKSFPTKENWENLKTFLPLPDNADEIYEEAARKDREVSDVGANRVFQPSQTVINPGTPATHEAAAWNGWGTCLKPALEPIVVARKPLEGTVAANVLKYGTGTINIDACRVPTEETWTHGATPTKPRGEFDGNWKRIEQSSNGKGRFPANLVHDGSPEALAAFPDSKGQCGAIKGTEPSESTRGIYGEFSGNRVPNTPRGDTGSASKNTTSLHPFPAIPPGTRKPNNKGKTTMSKKKTNPLDHVFGGTEYLKAKFDDIDEAVVSKKSKQAKDVKALVKRLATDKDRMYAYAVIKTAGKADGKPVSGYVVHVAMGLNGPGMGSDYAAALKRLLDTGKFCLLDAWIDAVDDLWDFILSVK